nr:hypothetical protein Iba_chr07cCG7680 [Ipomoea batatas]GMD17682.1 hypothetical protein Iba_chr07dCG5960 [Ipomoea batatas]
MFLVVNTEGALMSYQSFLAKGSALQIQKPFFPLEILLFLPTAMALRAA